MNKLKKKEMKIIRTISYSVILFFLVFITIDYLNYNQASVFLKDKYLWHVKIGENYLNYDLEDYFKRASFHAIEAIELNPDRLEGHLLKLKIHIRKRELETAKNEIEFLKEIYGDNQDLMIQEGRLLTRTKQYNESQEIFIQILQKNESNIVATAGLATAFASDQKYYEATKYWKRVLELAKSAKNEKFIEKLERDANEYLEDKRMIQ